MLRTRITVSFALALFAGAAQAAPMGTPLVPFPAFVPVPPKGMGMPGENKSGLATNGALAAPIWAADLAMMAGPLAMNKVTMNFSFSQCFGGGMIQPLTTLAGGAKITASSASQWNEFAWYPGVATKDWARAHIDALMGAVAAPAVDTYINGAFINDDYGAVKSTPAWEHAQFQESPVGAGAGTLTSAAGMKKAILYSGDPNAIDKQQIIDLFNVLKAAPYGYAAADITVVYGNGQAAAAPSGVNELLPADFGEMAVTIKPATKADLTAVFAGLGGLGMNDQLFFFANDHGVVQADFMKKWMRVPRRPGSSSPPPYSPGNPYGQLLGMFDFSGAEPEPLPEFAEFYVPTPGALALVGLSGILAAKRRRA